MKLSYDWLKDFADFDSVPFEKITEKIALSICEVDEVEEYKEFLEKVITVKIQSLEKHPSADKLSVCKVFDGQKEKIVVTAAKNLSISDIVPLATPGAIIGDKNISEAELRGIMSYGMFVSGKEMDINEDDSGVHIFPADTQIGLTIRQLFHLEDKIFHVDNKSITHRPDLWSHYGFARELCAQLNLPIRFNPFEVKYSFAEEKSVIEVLKNDNAHSYYASLIEGVKVCPSIEKFKLRLQKCGQKSINNVVDVSNYVMLEMGQPTHFFDKDSIGSIKIEVSPSIKNEKILLLDDSEKELEEGIILIRNASEPVAIAGVMGGLKSSVTNNTKNLVLESAVFKRENIRKSIRSTGIRSEASIRYEKGLDSSLSLPVLQRSLQLLEENAGGAFKAYKPEGFNNSAAKVVKINTDLEFIQKKLGKSISAEEVTAYLKRLYFSVKEKNGSFEVVVPKFRHNYDITIPEDLVEEIGRTMEYSNIENKPLKMDVMPVPISHKRNLERLLKNGFSRLLGFSEVFNYSFASEEDNGFEGQKEDSVAILNAMPEEQKFLRNSIYPSLIRNVQSNLDRFGEVKLFEYGRTYHKTEGKELSIEKFWFGFALSKNRKLKENLALLEDDFLQFRSDFEALFLSLAPFTLSFSSYEGEYLHPGAALKILIDNEEIAELGYIHPGKNESFGLKKRIILGKINFHNLLKAYEAYQVKNTFKAPSVYPGGEIDLSFVMEEERSTADLAELVKKQNIEELKSIHVQDIYRGENPGPGKKSVMYRLNLIRYDKTFTSERIQEISNLVIQEATKQGMELRK